MDSSAYQSVCKRPLDLLVAHALSELEKLRYSTRSLRRYRAAWEHLVRFAREMSRLQVPAAMKKSLSEYEQYCRKRRHLRASTLRGRMRMITVFLDELGSRNVTTLDQLQPADVAAFVASRGPTCPHSMSRTVSDVRCFLRFLLLRGILRQDLSQVLPRVRVPRDATIPSVWEPELVERLLKVIERTSPRGKRDYAILLLASRLGLRLGDIRRLTLDDLKWDTAAIEITRSKTGAPLCLP